VVSRSLHQGEVYAADDAKKTETLKEQRLSKAEIHRQHLHSGCPSNGLSIVKLIDR
jgi:hypothetical protein